MHAGLLQALFVVVALNVSIVASAAEPAPVKGAGDVAPTPQADANLTPAAVEAKLTQLRELCQKNQRKEVVEQFKDEDIAAWVNAFEDKTEGISKAVLALNLRGQSFAALKDYERAKKDYTFALELSPSNGYIWHSMGDVYRGMKDNDKALDAYIKAFEYDRAAHTKKSFGWMPISATLEAATILMGQSKYPEALKIMERYDDNDIQKMSPYSGRRLLRTCGQIYAATGREEEALAKFKEANKLETR